MPPVTVSRPRIIVPRRPEIASALPSTAGRAAGRGRSPAGCAGGRHGCGCARWARERAGSRGAPGSGAPEVAAHNRRTIPRVHRAPERALGPCPAPVIARIDVRAARASLGGPHRSRRGWRLILARGSPPRFQRDEGRPARASSPLRTCQVQRTGSLLLLRSLLLRALLLRSLLLGHVMITSSSVK